MTDAGAAGDLYLDSQPAVDAFLGGLRGVPLLAVDTEAASFHRYRDRIYLIQLSTRDRTAVIDPVAVTDLDEIHALLAEHCRGVLSAVADDMKRAAEAAG